jgi:hypothetical protein
MGGARSLRHHRSGAPKGKKRSTPRNKQLAALLPRTPHALRGGSLPLQAIGATGPTEAIFNHGCITGFRLIVHA